MFRRHHAAWPVALAAGLAFATAAGLFAAEQSPAAPARASAPPRACTAGGLIKSGEVALPGATITAKAGERVVAMTSSDLDGTFLLSLDPGTYSIHADLTAFAPVERELTVGQPPCDVALNLALTLASRVPGAVRQAAAPPPAEPARSAGPADSGRGGRGGRGNARFGGPPRFQALSVRESDEAAQAPVEESGPDVVIATRSDDPAARMLPPGFSLDAPLESVAVSGSLVSLDRAGMNERMAALERGEFGLAEGQQFALAGQGLGPGIDAGGRAGGPGGRGGGAGGPGGAGFIGGRGVAGANRVQATANYGFGGSALDAAPYSLRGETPRARDYVQQNFSTTIGGPVRIPHVYDGARRTTFNFSYTGSRNGDLFDQYATVPSEAFRSGDFSSSPFPIIDPLTGAPFPGNRIPASRIDPAAAALLPFIPDPTLPGESQNFRYVATSHSTSDAFTLRLTHSFTPPPAANTGRGGRGGQGAPGGAAPGGARGGFGGRGGPGGQGGRGNFQPPLNITMNASVSYRRSNGDRLNVFPDLAGRVKGTALSVPVTVNMRAGRSMHAFNASFNRTSSTTLSDLAFRQDVTGDAGITGVSTDPFDWGVPNLTFGSLTALRDVAPSWRTDRSFQVGYTWTRPVGTHTYRAGASFQQQDNRTLSDANARGTYTFTGLYTAGGANIVRGGGQDLADFLLGLPQQATRQYSMSVDNISSPVEIRGRQMSLYLQDDWRLRARWTINYGFQYDVIAPFTEQNGHMVNLDASPDFSAVAPVSSGGIGPFSGVFPGGLVRTDWNNVAPRVGVAWRASNRSVVRFGYGLSYNNGAYSSIARQLYQQPPFFLTGTSLGSLASPLSLSDAFSGIGASTVTNNYGIDRNYQLGEIQQWNVDYARDLFRSWNAGVTYVGTHGSHLDMLRAPNRGPTGLRIEGVDPFTWQSSQGASQMNGVSARLQKRQTRGISGTVSYTLARSRDNTTATGGGATVAQDDQNLAAEWGLSSFDRRHQFSGNLSAELPWGRNRRWLAGGGWLAAMVGDWSMSANLTWQSGTPLTVRCSTCASDVARGTGGTLRADYTGAPIALAHPTIDAFFNTAAFALPATGTYGNSLRNMLTGPGSHQLNASFTRDLILGGNRGASINVNATNLLNTVVYGSIDTNVNSPTFGQVLSVRGMRTVRLNIRFRF